jgi:hypothetical protein
MTDPAPYLGAAVLVVALCWAACYAHTATRGAARALAWPALALVAGLGVLVSLLSLRPRRRAEPAALPPSEPDPGAATYTAQVAADRDDAAERETTREAVRAAESTGDAAPLLDREREMRARLGLPPID